MRSFLKRVWEDVKHGENIDLLVTVGLGLVLAILNILGIPSSSVVSSVILATLGLIAIGLLVTRYKLDDIYQKENVANSVQLHARKIASLADDFAAAKEVWMVGLTLRGTTTRNFHVFKGKAERGGKYRTLIVNVNDIEMESVVRRFSRGGNVEQFRADFAQTLNQYKQIRQSARNPDNIQVRLLDFVPSVSLYIFPKTDEGGIVYVEIYGYKSPLGSSPRFRVTEREHPEWYKLYVDQFEAMWKDANPVSL